MDREGALAGEGEDLLDDLVGGLEGELVAGAGERDQPAPGMVATELGGPLPGWSGGPGCRP